jgi:hypothetical protein
MTEQPDALRLADEIERTGAHQVAAELRRLHQENEWLLGELETAYAKAREKLTATKPM